jgi:hypothetical protein
MREISKSKGVWFANQQSQDPSSPRGITDLGRDVGGDTFDDELFDQTVATEDPQGAIFGIYCRYRRLNDTTQRVRQLEVTGDTENSIQ